MIRINISLLSKKKKKRIIIKNNIQPKLNTIFLFLKLVHFKFPSIIIKKHSIDRYEQCESIERKKERW